MGPGAQGALSLQIARTHFPDHISCFYYPPLNQLPPATMLRTAVGKMQEKGAYPGTPDTTGQHREDKRGTIVSTNARASGRQRLLLRTLVRGQGDVGSSLPVHSQLP